jgi:hypothetical protein
MSDCHAIARISTAERQTVASARRGRARAEVRRERGEDAVDSSGRRFDLQRCSGLVPGTGFEAPGGPR